MNNIFSFTGARKIVFGCGSLEGLPGHIAELGARKPLVVLDGHLSAQGFRDNVSHLFGDDPARYCIFDEITGEPSLEVADKGAVLARAEGCDIVVGIGGGSTLDAAKAMAIIVTNGGEARQYLGLNNVPRPGLPKIMIPTTAGTGSEVTFTAVFIRKDLKKKEGMNSPYLYPELALLDPLLTVSVPPDVTASTGLDALCHAIESYTSIIANPMSEMISLEAIGLIASNLRTSVHNGSDIRARENMLLGSLYAGLGLANAGVTAVHSLSYPLGGTYGIPHGLANTIMLPPVMRFNVAAALDKFADIAEVMGEDVESFSVREAAFMAIDAVEDLIEDCGIMETLEDLGINKDDFEMMADAAMGVARPLANNPRVVTRDDAIAMYEEAY